MLPPGRGLLGSCRFALLPRLTYARCRSFPAHLEVTGLALAMIAVSLLRRSIRDAARSQKRCFSSFPSSRTSLSARRSIPGVNHIVAVASGKGGEKRLARWHAGRLVSSHEAFLPSFRLGVGKSTTAINIATALANCLGLRVGLLDADVYGEAPVCAPSQPPLRTCSASSAVVASRWTS